MEKKYRCIVKIGNRDNGSAHCLKYHVNNLLKFTAFLDEKHPDWRWYNVYSQKTGEQISNFTRHQRPRQKWVGP
jgi:hypothetical protein